MSFLETGYADYRTCISVPSGYTRGACRALPPKLAHTSSRKWESISHSLASRCFFRVVLRTWPSIVATVLGGLGVWSWFLPPLHSFALQDRTEAYGILGFLTFSSAIIALGESSRRGSAARSRLAAIASLRMIPVIVVTSKFPQQTS